jgi:hypothetical protein
VGTEVPAGADAKEQAWLSIEFTRWESAEDWAMQAFFRLPERAFSLSTDSSLDPPVLHLLVEKMSDADVVVIQEILKAHFGSGVAAGQSRIADDY